METAGLGLFAHNGRKRDGVIYPPSLALEASFYQSSEQSLRQVFQSYPSEVRSLLEGYTWEVGDSAHGLTSAQGAEAFASLDAQFKRRPAFTESADIETTFSGQFSTARIIRAYIILAALFDAVNRHETGDLEYGNLLPAVSSLAHSWRNSVTM